jgi:hypothetical protein
MKAPCLYMALLKNQKSLKSKSYLHKARVLNFCCRLVVFTLCAFFFLSFQLCGFPYSNKRQWILNSWLHFTPSHAHFHDNLPPPYKISKLTF